MTFRVPVIRVDRFEDHPKNPNSTITHFVDRYFDEFTEVQQAIEYQVVSSRLEDGSPRYTHGDAAIFMKGDSVVPLEYLAFIGYAHDDGKPMFKGGRVKAGNFQTVKSDGILTPVTVHLSESGAHISDTVTFPDGTTKLVKVGDDLQKVLGIVEYVGK